jgi:hypothetical protein
MPMAVDDYLNFELNIEAFDDKRIRATVDDSPVGSVAAEVVNPFTPDEISRVIGVLQGSIPTNRAERAQVARAFGEKLFNTIFSGQIYAAYLASLGRAGSAGLRIKLCLEDAGPLRDVPWELLRDPRSDYLALTRQTPIIRYPRLLTVRPLVEVTLPLRVLVMISSPGDQDALDIEGEWQALQQATADFRNRGLLELERLDDAQLITLQRKLGEGSTFQVFHYIGHAAFDESSQTGMLAFENPRSNATVPVSGESLARELSEENTIRLVVMNACQGARQNNTDPFAGIASSIVARGLPAVVAMQFSISDEASRIFSEAFYRALSEGYPIETAVTEARRAISSSIDNFEWATPVLYLRAPTGVLFPRRKSEDVPASAGGLREVLRSPMGLAGIAIVLLLLFGFLLGPVRSWLTTTPTPTPGTFTDANLTISRVRVQAVNPGPGQRVPVHIVIRNEGTTDSGPFKVAWFADIQQSSGKPDIIRDIDNVGPGAERPIFEDFAFPRWGTYTTTAWVNFADPRAAETNPLDNLKQSPPVQVSGPLVVDFTRLPDGSPLFQSTLLKGDEFNPWGVTMAPDPAGTSCSGTLLRLNAEETVNRLVIGQDDANQCTDLPIVFTLAEPVGSATVEFFPRAAGTYTLELFDANGRRLQSNPIEVTPAQVETPMTVPVPASSAVLNNVRKARFVGPDQARIAIQRITFSLPTSALPTATPTP